MDWTILGALGEFLGAIAVVASLLYLAREVRQANRIARAEAYRSFMSGMANLVSRWASDPDWAELLVRLRIHGHRRKDLNARERAVAALHLQSVVDIWAASHHDVRLGILPPSAYDIVGERTFRMPYLQDVWPLLREDHSLEFAQVFEERFGLSPTSESIQDLPPGTDTE
jgi:hypothetical protein